MKAPVVKVKSPGRRFNHFADKIGSAAKSLGDFTKFTFASNAVMDGAAMDTDELQHPYIQEAWIAAAADFRAFVNALAKGRLWDRDPDDPSAEEITSGPLYELFNRPNAYFQGPVMRIVDSLNRDLFNESIHVLLDEKGNPIDVGNSTAIDAPIPIPSSILPVKGTAVDLELDEKSRPKLWRIPSSRGSWELRPGQVHVHGLTPDPYRAYRYLGPAAKTWGPAAARYLANRFQRFLMGNAGEPGGIVTIPGVLSLPEMKRLEDELAEQWGDPAGAGAWRILQGDAKVERTRSSPRDMEWPSVHAISREDISADWGVSKALLGMDDANNATFQGHWKMFLEAHAMPSFIVQEQQWNALFRRIKSPAARNVHLRFDTEMLDTLFATLEEKAQNAKIFFGMGVSLDESLRQAGVKADPIEGGDVHMLNQGIRPLVAGVALGRAEAAIALQEAGVKGQDALNEVGLGHLEWQEPKPPASDEIGADQAKPDNGADHEDEVVDRGMTVKESEPSEEGQDEVAEVDEIVSERESKFETKVRDVMYKMLQAQIRELERHSKGLEPELHPQSPLHGLEFEGHSKQAPIEFTDMVGLGSMIEADGTTLRQLAKYLQVEVQQLKDFYALSKVNLTESQVELLLSGVTDRRWVHVLADVIEPFEVEAAKASSGALFRRFGLEPQFDDSIPVEMRARSLQVAEGTTSVVARRIRSELIRVLAEGGDAQSLQQAVEASLQDLKASTTSAFRSLQRRAGTIARTELRNATSHGRSHALHALAIAGKVGEFEWVTSLRSNRRDSHKTMHGQRRLPGNRFETGDGVLMRRPHDPDAPAAEVVECNCIMRGIPKAKT